MFFAFLSVKFGLIILFIYFSVFTTQNYSYCCWRQATEVKNELPKSMINYRGQQLAAMVKDELPRSSTNNRGHQWLQRSRTSYQGQLQGYKALNELQGQQQAYEVDNKLQRSSTSYQFCKKSFYEVWCFEKYYSFLTITMITGASFFYIHIVILVTMI